MPGYGLPEQPKIKNEEHLTMVDHLRAQFQEPGYQREYLQNQANQRKAEYDAEQERQRRAAAKGGQ
jgi:hypothetical protein